jgi:formate hydrogenlyase transcriptional activator
LKRAGGRIYGRNGAAELLGIKPTTLQSRLRALGIRASDTLS